MNPLKSLLITIILLVFIIDIFEFTAIDMWFETLMRDHGHWLLGRNDEPWRFIFYDGIKKLFGVVALLLLLSLLFLRNKINFINTHQRGLWVVMITMVAVPLLVNFLKWYTDIPCPRDIIEFGGDAPHVSLFTHYPDWFLHESSLRCYPAGHASGGFALMSLYFAFESPTWRRSGILLGLTVGWVIGFYKMMIGDHFLSHTVISMMVAWLVACLAAYLIKYNPLIATKD